MCRPGLGNKKHLSVKSPRWQHAVDCSLATSSVHLTVNCSLATSSVHPFPQQHRSRFPVAYGSALTNGRRLHLQLPQRTEERPAPWCGPSWAASVHIKGNSLDTWRQTPSGFRCAGQSGDTAGSAGWIRCHTWSTYILFWNRRKRCREMSVSPHLSGQRHRHFTSKNSGGECTPTRWREQSSLALRQIFQSNWHRPEQLHLNISGTETLRHVFTCELL